LKIGSKAPLKKGTEGLGLIDAGVEVLEDVEW
jgi:hypothetical protein